MKNWSKLVDTFHADSYTGEYQTLRGQPASIEAISKLASSLNFPLPEEFYEFYATFDGIKQVSKSGSCESGFLALKDLPPFADEVRNWFRVTHPNLAERFFPFFDWGCGDATGYLLDSNNQLLPGLFHFWHEDYLFEAGQPEESFIIRTDDSIEGFLLD